VEISLSPVTIQGRAYTMASVRDVSERRRLQAERDRIQAALDACYDAVYLIEQASLLVRYVNHGAQVQSGYSAAELLQMSERSFRYYAKKYGIRKEEEVYEDPGVPIEEG
jgi:PAS domain-containing protein